MSGARHHSRAVFGTLPGSLTMGGGGATYSVAASGARSDVALGGRRLRSKFSPVTPPEAPQVTPRVSAINWARRANTGGVGSSAVNVLASSKAPINGTRTTWALI